MSTIPGAFHPFFRSENPADTYIAVRRDCDPNDGQNRDKAQELAQKRAESIAAVMALWLFGRTSQKQTCGIHGNFNWRFSRVISFGYPTSTITSGSVAHQHAANVNPIIVVNANEYTRQSFISDIHQDNFKFIFDAVVMRDPHYAPNLTILERACERLTEGIYSQQLGEFTVSTVTALEILLAVDNSKEKVVQARYTTLVTGHALKTVREVYTARNNWVHRGTDVSKEDAFKALSIGISALISVAGLLHKMPAKSLHTSVLAYLDVVAIAKTMPSNALGFVLQELPNELKP